MNTEETKDTSKSYLTNFKTLEEKFEEYLTQKRSKHNNERLLEAASKDLAKIAREHFSHFGDD